MIFICHVVAGIEFRGSFHLNSLQATINENRLDSNKIGWDFGFAAVLAVCAVLAIQIVPYEQCTCQYSAKCSKNH